MQYVIAFVTGGMICALSQILMEKTKMLPGRIMVLLVCTGALLGAVAIYPPFVEFAGAGAHRQVAGHDDRVGLLGVDGGVEPGDRRRVLRAEMDVADMKQADHSRPTHEMRIRCRRGPASG